MFLLFYFTAEEPAAMQTSAASSPFLQPIWTVSTVLLTVPSIVNFLQSSGAHFIATEAVHSSLARPALNSCRHCSFFINSVKNFLNIKILFVFYCFFETLVDSFHQLWDYFFTCNFCMKFLTFINIHPV